MSKQKTHAQRIEHLEGCQESTDKRLLSIDERITKLIDIVEHIRKDVGSTREVVFNGLRENVREMREKFGDLVRKDDVISKEHVVTRQDLKEELSRLGVGVSRRTITIRRILEVAVTATVVGIAIIAAVMLVAGRLTADDIADILRAWHGM